MLQNNCSEKWGEELFLEDSRSTFCYASDRYSVDIKGRGQINEI